MSESESEANSKNNGSDAESEENESGSNSGSGSDKGSDNEENSRSEDASEQEGSDAESKAKSGDESDATSDGKGKKSKKKVAKFNGKLLSITSEVKIDIISPQSKINGLDFDINSYNSTSDLKYARKNRCLDLLNSVNTDLDKLHDNLSNSIRNFDSDRRSQVSRTYDTRPISPRSYNSHVDVGTNVSAGFDNNPYGYTNAYNDPYSTGGRNNKGASDKETNTENFYSSNRRKEQNSSSHRFERTNNNYNNTNGSPGNKYNYKIRNNSPLKESTNNRIRTVEDLYRNTKQPVIYNKYNNDHNHNHNSNRHNHYNAHNSNNNFNQNVNRLKKTNYELESDHANSDHNNYQKKYNYNQYLLSEKQRFKPKNIDHAVDILLDKN